MMSTAIIVLALAHFICTYYALRNSDVGRFLRFVRRASLYMPAIFNIRLFVMTTLLFAYNFGQGKALSTSLILIVMMVYILFIVFFKPHLIDYDTYRSLFIEIGLLCVLILRTIEINILANLLDPRSAWYNFLVSLEYIIYIMGIVVSVLSLIYHLRYTKAKKAENYEA